MTVPKDLQVESEILEWLGIYRMVVESWSLPVLEGYPNVQPFTITAISDQPIELRIRDGL